jgi:succinate dehydrogenase / fumarate reductase cytochrome b subunit
MLKHSRPLSPFLHYRWQYTNTLSILHRVTGIVLCVGFLVLVYWITAIASGPVAYARSMRVLSHPLSEALLGLALLAFAYHFCNGVRHLLWDAGFGFERRAARRSAWIVVLATILISLLVGSIVFFGRGGVS